jgi:predicted RNA-binding Zn-ribbon protein involved in translation (DUF1610 family)
MTVELKRAGVVCPKGRQPLAIIDDRNPTMFRCPACGHERMARLI